MTSPIQPILPRQPEPTPIIPVDRARPSERRRERDPREEEQERREQQREPETPPAVDGDGHIDVLA